MCKHTVSSSPHHHDLSTQAFIPVSCWQCKILAYSTLYHFLRSFGPPPQAEKKIETSSVTTEELQSHFDLGDPHPPDFDLNLTLNSDLLG